MLLKNVSSFAPSTLKAVNLSAFLKLVMVGHGGSHTHTQLNNTVEVIPYIDIHKKNYSNEPKNEYDEGFGRA